MTTAIPVTVAKLERALVALEVATWLGTPFHHAARLKGIGVDCAQLLVAVFKEVGLIDEPAIDFYSPDWFLHVDRERLLEIVEQYCVPSERVDVGDVSLFQFGRTVSHGGIVISLEPELTIVHSFRDRGVILDSLAPGQWLAGRLVGHWTLKRWAFARAA